MEMSDCVFVQKQVTKAPRASSCRMWKLKKLNAATAHMHSTVVYRHIMTARTE